MRARKAEERKTQLEAIQAVFSGLGQGSKTLLEDRAKMTALVGGLTALAVGVYSARAATRVAGNLVERQLMRPPLVRETSRFTWNQGAFAYARQWFPWGKKDGPLMEKIVLEEELSERLAWTTNSLVNAKRNGTPFRSVAEPYAFWSPRRGGPFLTRTRFEVRPSRGIAFLIAGGCPRSSSGFTLLRAGSRSESSAGAHQCYGKTRRSSPQQSPERASE